MKLSKITLMMATCCTLLLGACHTHKKVSYMRKFDHQVKFNMDGVIVHFRHDTVQVIFPELSMFDFNQDQIKPNAQPALVEFSRALKEFDRVDFIINGYTDNIGSEDVNHPLSKRRAENVEAFFEAHNVAASRMTTHGRGAENPVADNSTEDGRKANRRVEFLLYEKK